MLAAGHSGLHAIYEAPGVHSSPSAIPLILAAKPAGIAIQLYASWLRVVAAGEIRIMLGLSGLYPRHDNVELLCRAMEPVGAPDAMDRPAVTLQHGLA